MFNLMYFVFLMRFMNGLFMGRDNLFEWVSCFKRLNNKIEWNCIENYLLYLVVFLMYFWFKLK